MLRHHFAKEMIVIRRQLLLNDISLFTSAPKSRFYETLFLHLDLSILSAAAARTGRKGFPKAALLAAFIVMKCEGFAQITDLIDYLTNNLIIAHYCGFDIMKPLPDYSTFTRFLRKFDNDLLGQIMHTQVQRLVQLGIIDTSFIGLDSTPVFANTVHNNPKSFVANKFSKANPPAADHDCALGVHSASNQSSEKNFWFYWGYKNHVLVDCISGLPIYELTTPANVADCSVALDVLSATNRFLPLDNCTFIADKGYDAKHIYNTVKYVYHGDCVIPINPRNHKTSDCKWLHGGNPLCAAGLAMSKDGRDYSQGRCRQKFCCPYKLSKDDSRCPICHPLYHNGKKHRGCTKYITLPDDYRLSIDRNSISFRIIYALRSESERYNSRFKASGQERLWVRTSSSAKNLNTIAHISLLAVALAAVLTQAPVSYRCIKSIKRIA